MRGREADATVAAPLGVGGTGASILGLLAVLMLAAVLVLPAGASAEPFANLGSFGTPNGTQGGQLSNARGVAVNRSGDGAPAGSVYVAEGFPSHRVSQFTGSGEFVRTWGFDVVDGVNHPGAANDNGTGFEVCDVTAGNTAVQCKAGVSGAAAGQLANPMGIAVDQSNGYLYVTSSNNLRVDVFSGSGEFAGAFGYDVLSGDPDPSGPDFCTTATGCQAATAGGDAGRFGSWNTSTPAVDPDVPGRVYVPDPANQRVSHYETTVAGGVLTDASFVKAFGSDVVSSGPGNRTVDRNERQTTRVAALDFSCFCFVPVTGGTWTLAFDPDGGGAAPAETTGPIPYNANAAVIQQRLVDDLASIAPGDVTVSPDPGPDADFIVEFTGAYAGDDVADMVADGSNLTADGGAFAVAEVATIQQGGQYPAGYEVCVPADGDSCKAGASGNGSGEFTSESPTAAAVGSTGAIYATSGPLAGGFCSEATPCRVQKFSPDAATVGDFGPTSGPGQLTFTTGAANAVAGLNLAVDPADDHVLVLRKESSTTYRVVEYDSAGAHIDTHPAGAALPASTSTTATGIGVGPTGRIYVNYGGGVGAGRVFILGPVDPPTVTIAPVSGVGETSATFSGTVTIPAPGAPTFTTGYRFEYSSNGVDWTRIPQPDGSVGDGSVGTHPVSQTVMGLQPNTLYAVRLVATTGPSATSATVSFTTGAVAPRVAQTFVDEVTQNSARLGAHVDPQGSATTYHFEWGSQPCSSSPDACAEVPGFERQLGNGNEIIIANETITGLDQATTYHYRVIATNPAGQTAGPDQTFETLNECNLTDDRCYELVSPPDKGAMGAAGDYVALGQELSIQPAADIPAVAYTLAYGLPGGTAGDEAVVQSNRTDAGWTTQQLEAPAVVSRDTDSIDANTSLTKGLTRNLECGLFTSPQPLGDNPPLAALQAGAVAFYSRSATGTWTTLTDSVPTNPLKAEGNFEFALIGVSQDQPCARVAFASQYEYPGIDGVGNNRLYWWEGGVLSWVGVIPGPCAGGGCVAGAVAGAPEFTGVTVGAHQSRNFQRAVSEDGSRVFFTANSQQGGDTGRQALFVRDRDMPVGLDVSQSQTGSLPGGTANNDDVEYQTASVDGSKVFFTGRYGLASNQAGDAVHSSTGATACADNGTGCDLYQYDVGSGKLTDLSVPDPDITTNTQGASVAGVLAADDDGSHVYFATRGRLMAGEGATEARNLSDETLNVYLAHNGSFSYVGRIESPGHYQLVRMANGFFKTWTTRASADGGRLLFESTVNLTDYDARGVRQVYLYDAASGETTCVSCRRDGGPPTAIPLTGALVTITDTATVAQPRTLTEDGRRVFFFSYDDLATGGTQGRRNLYQWEEGQVSFLASSGPNANARSLWFGGGSASGDDVYFGTVDKYTWQDVDFRMDMYDARVGGGFAEPPPVAPPCDPLADGACPQDGGAPKVEPPVDTQADGTGNSVAPARAAFSVKALSARQLRALAAGRRVAVGVRVSRPGRVSARGVARIGRFRVTVMSAARDAKRAGVVALPVRLSKAARARLARTGSLAVGLTVRFGGARRASARRLVLRTPGARSKRKLKTNRQAGSRAATTNGRAGK